MSNLVDYLPGENPAWLRGLGRRLATWRHAAGAPAAGEAPALAEGDQGASASILIVELGGWRSGALPDRLQKAGYRTRVVRGVPAALESHRREPVALCIVGGRVDFAACRTLHETLSAPVLAFVIYGDVEQAVTLLDAGADDCQASTISPQEVLARIRSLLQNHAVPLAGRP